MTNAGILLIALALDACIGDPDWLYARVPHPVVWFGRLISMLDHALNHDGDGAWRRRLKGVAATAILVAATAGPAWLVARLLSGLPWGGLAQAVLASTLIAQHSLYRHVAAVAAALGPDGSGDDRLAAARRAVSRIVGRDPDSLDRHGVARAAIESCAENFSDGVVAPAFWCLMLGLPGLVAYKAINTADSMIGHRTPRHEAFGWAAARLDDLVNLVPARLAGMLLVTAAAAVPGARPGRALSVMLRDAGRHRSPNAGWQEAAVAGALGVALAGPRRYGPVVVEDGWMGCGLPPEAETGHVRNALRLMAAAAVLEAALVALMI